MSKILILGGTGYTGRLIAQHLLEHSKADITIATRHLDGAQAFADKLNRQYPDHRVKAIYADASQKDSLHRAFEDQRMVVVAAPTTAHAENVIRTSLEMGLDYLDVQFGAQKLALLQSLAYEIENAGLWMMGHVVDPLR